MIQQRLRIARFLNRGLSIEKHRHSSVAFEAMISHSRESSVGLPLEGNQIGSALDCSSDKRPKSRFSKEGGGGGDGGGPSSEMDLLKERFAKLLLGEDMSGGGKGVSSALAISNAITNLAASIFSEQGRLEPMPAERKGRWQREIDCLLSVADYIVEFVPSKGGSNVEAKIMVTQQRKDLQMNIPALRKLDAMLIGFLDNFKEQREFWYVSRNADEAEQGDHHSRDDKWWHPKVEVPPYGLSEVFRRWLQFLKESVNQVLKAAMAINAQVLMEMDVPEAYIESLPRNGRASLGDAIYRSITDDFFDPEQFLQTMDTSTEHKVLDLKNRIEASIVIWKRKMHNNKDGKSAWGSAVSLEKREQFEERAETILHLIKQKFPGIPQSALDISKIQYNKDVGQSILESYSRILESLAYTIMSRIEDILYADSLVQHQSSDDSDGKQLLPEAGLVRRLDAREEVEKLKEVPSMMALSDFMGWHYVELEAELEKKKKIGNMEDSLSSEEKLKKPINSMTKKYSFMEKLEHEGGSRSPTSRH